MANNNNIAEYNAKRKAEAEAKKAAEKLAEATAATAPPQKFDVKKAENFRKTLAEQFKDCDKVAVIGSPMYRPWFGETMLISINGVEIYLPLDGQKYEIPEPFAFEFYDRIARVDEDIAMRNRLADVQNNVETYVGEKDLIRRA